MTEAELLRELARLFSVREKLETLPLPAENVFKSALNVFVKLENMGDVQDVINNWLANRGKDLLWTELREWVVAKEAQIDNQIATRKAELQAIWATP